jgi:hypothetical protein
LVFSATILAMVEPLQHVSSTPTRQKDPYQFPDPITVTLCFFEYAPRVAMLADREGARWLEVWARRRAAELETGAMA